MSDLAQFSAVTSTLDYIGNWFISIFFCQFAKREAIARDALLHQMIVPVRSRMSVTKLLCVLVVLLTTNVLHAEVMLSEIMYNPQNGGANRDWVELYNSGTSAVNLSGWQFGLPTNNTLGYRATSGDFDWCRPGTRAHAEQRDARLGLGHAALTGFRSATSPR